MDGKVACDVLTGFLGSGKTTLLNAFLHERGTDGIAVIVNEFGAIGLDQFVFQEVADNVYLLDSGCLCCTLTHSLRETLLQIKDVAAQAGHANLQQVIIETTGLADPLPILHALLGDRALMDHFRLGRVIATVDAVQGAAQLHTHRESLRQASVADQLVITKIDLAEPASLQALHRLLEHVNPHAKVCESTADQAVTSVFDTNETSHSMALLSLPQYRVEHDTTGSSTLAGQPEATHDHGVHDNGIGSWSAFIEVQPTWAGVSAWWNLLVQHYQTRLLRCKGLLRMDDVRPFVLIQGVGKVFHSPTFLARWPDVDPRSRLVCIGLELDMDWLQDSLRALSIVEPSSRPLTLDEINDCLS
ncbi:MAG: GTP-binding protein [Paralcaligenes sp.]